MNYNHYNNKAKKNYKYKTVLKIFFVFLFIFVSYYDENNLNIDLIKVGYYCISLKNGGVERVMSLLIHYLSEDKRFSHFLITKKDKEEGEYSIPSNTKRISLNQTKISLTEVLKLNHIDILIYNFYDKSEIKLLNKLNSTKIIYYNHASIFLRIYMNVYYFKDTVYYEYQKCKYIISIIPLENDYLFKKWGINSIIMDNPSTFEYDSVIPSDLSQKNIIMIGRANDYIKRFDLGIKAMVKITREIPKCEMNIISYSEKSLENLIKNLKLENNVKFIGYKKNIEIYLKNSCLHILTSLSESYCMVLSETKIFGIPSIIVGLDYLALARGGTVIIYDDNPNTIAEEAIKILRDDDYRRQLGKDARKSMRIHQNKIIAKKWIKLLLTVYNGKIESYIRLSERQTILREKDALKILNNQLILLKKRIPNLTNLTIEKLINYSFI